jgi:hypothetical protein
MFSAQNIKGKIGVTLYSETNDWSGDQRLEVECGPKCGPKTKRAPFWCP